LIFARINTLRQNHSFPKCENKFNKGFINDAIAEQIKSAASGYQVTGITLTFLQHHEVEFAAIKEADKKKAVFHILRTIHIKLTIV
jgi:hypothetical protein